MPHALNLTLPIRQDAETKKRLEELKRTFAAGPQKKIDTALRASQTVHSARVVVIDDKYLQVLTVYDGDHREYTEFFRKELPDVFALLFSLAETPPDRDDLKDPDAFFRFAASCQVRSLGESTEGLTGVGGESEGYLFSAFGSRTVKQILPKLEG
ncbi:MAG: hypothetical protein ACJ8AW_53325 [Rhodopila sp.]